MQRKQTDDKFSWNLGPNELNDTPDLGSKNDIPFPFNAHHSVSLPDGHLLPSRILPNTTFILMTTYFFSLAYPLSAIPATNKQIPPLFSRNRRILGEPKCLPIHSLIALFNSETRTGTREWIFSTIRGIERTFTVSINGTFLLAPRSQKNTQIFPQNLRRHRHRRRRTSFFYLIEDPVPRFSPARPNRIRELSLFSWFCGLTALQHNLERMKRNRSQSVG